MKNLTSFNTIAYSFSAFICFFLLSFQLALGVETEKIVVLGDVEGRGFTLDSFINNSEAFVVSDSGEIAIKPGYKFIFMGDAVDRGDASLRVLQTILRLKETFPDNVVLILGNRDLNKLRLPIELSPEALAQPPSSRIATQPYTEWLNENGYEIALFSDGPTRLKWILSKTMGAPGAFEFRRQELKNTYGRDISDRNVFESFLSDFGKHGIMTRYLKAAQLGYYSQEQGTIVVHGGITKKSLGHIPGQAYVEKIIDWIPQLNEWAQKNIRLMLDGNIAGLDIVNYQQPIPNTLSNDYSVVYSRNFNLLTANPELPEKSVQQRLLSQGFHTLIVGHTPIGELPLVISNGKFRVLYTDNSASNLQVASSTIIANGTIKVKSPFRPDIINTTISYEHTLGVQTEVGRQTVSGWAIARIGDYLLTVNVDKSQKFKINYSLVQTPNKCINFFSK